MDNHVNIIRKWDDPLVKHQASVSLRALETQLDEFPEANWVHDDLFADRSRWPIRPYCSDDKTCSRIRKLDSAKSRYQYIQPNPPLGKAWLVFDVDRPQAAYAAEDAGLPPPTWSTTNRATGHAHLVYGLTVPVLMASAARYKPIRLLSVIEESFTVLLKADPSYVGLLTKNPLHPRWRVMRGPRPSYELDELAEYVPEGFSLPKPRRLVDVSGMSGLQRNVGIFDSLRLWAYEEIRRFDDKDYRELVGIDWGACVNVRAHEINDGIRGAHGPLSVSEVDGIARSVAKWVQRHHAAVHSLFVERQRARALRSASARRDKSGPDRARASAMSAAGDSTRKIARSIGVNQSTVFRWLAEAGG